MRIKDKIMPNAGILKLSPLTKDAQKSLLPTVLWYRDTACQMDNANYKPADDQNVIIQKYNIGLRNRSKWKNESKLVTVIGKLHFDFFHQPIPLENNVGHLAELCKVRFNIE